MFKGLISDLAVAAIKAASPIIRKKELEEYANIKAKVGTTETPADDIAVEVLGVLIGAGD